MDPIVAFYTSGGRDETEKMLRDELERVKAALNEEHENVEFVQLKLQRDDLKSAFEQMNKEHEAQPLTSRSKTGRLLKNKITTTI